MTASTALEVLERTADVELRGEAKRRN